MQLITHITRISCIKHLLALFVLFTLFEYLSTYEYSTRIIQNIWIFDSYSPHITRIILALHRAWGLKKFFFIFDHAYQTVFARFIIIEPIVIDPIVIEITVLSWFVID